MLDPRRIVGRLRPGHLHAVKSGGWYEVRTLMKRARSRDRVVVVVVMASPRGVLGAGVETSAEACESGINFVLEDHAHEVIAEGKRLAPVLAKCDEYLRRWRRSRARRPACGCPTIAG